MAQGCHPLYICKRHMIYLLSVRDLLLKWLEIIKMKTNVSAHGVAGQTKDGYGTPLAHELLF